MNIFADSEQFSIGDYFIIGQYKGAPILWRYAADDDNGMLIVSDKVITYKSFDDNSKSGYKSSNLWETSYIRIWLNSTMPAGEIEWPVGETPTPNNLDGRRNEAGFLSSGNFTQAELDLMKTVNQWTMTPSGKVELSENGLSDGYICFKDPGRGGGHSPTTPMIFWDISEFPNVFFGAAYQLEDTVFLLDELQLYRMWENLGNVNAVRTDESKPNEQNDGEPQVFLLRTPIFESMVAAWDKDKYETFPAYAAISAERGIRPAFYLDTEAIETITGSGTENDPYILNASSNNTEQGGEESDASDNITVILNSQTLAFDQPPIMENDRVLVPFRAIFEAFGAEVGWNGETQTVTAKKGDLEMSLQIDNNQITVNGKTVTLDVPPRLVSSRTLVPVRAVSEGLGAKVGWDDAKQQVIITTE